MEAVAESEIQDKDNSYIVETGHLDFEKVLLEILLFAYLVGGRSIGKTFGAMKYSLKESLNSFLAANKFENKEEFDKLERIIDCDWQFFYLRRTLEQAKETVKGASGELIKYDHYKFFLDKLNEIDEEILETYNVSIEYDGDEKGVRNVLLYFEDKENRKINKAIRIGRLCAVSAAEKIRGPGIEQIKLMIFDEFQAKKFYSYLPNEPDLLLDIYDSVTRDRDDCKLVALGNSGSILNPHFAYYDYSEFEQLRTEKKNGAAVFYHFEIIAPSRKSGGAFNDLTKGTAYGDYAIGNKFGDNENFNVVRLADAPGPRQYLYTVTLTERAISVWKDGQGRAILSKVIDKEKPHMVDSAPIGNQIYDLQTYQVLADQIKNKYLYFDTPDLRLTAEKHLRKYMFKTNHDDWERMA